MTQNPANVQPFLPEPRGFGEHTRRTSGENAHEQGWGLNEEERRHIPADQQRRGGTDYAYGAQDFGDSPVDVSNPHPSASTRVKPVHSAPQNGGEEANRKRSARRQAG